MFKLIKRFTSKQSDRQSKIVSSKQKTAVKKKLQARKKHSEQAFELLWMQHVLAGMAAHKVKVSILLLVITLMSIPILMSKTQWLPIQKIVLSGQFIQLKTDVLESNLKPFLGKGFFSVDIRDIQLKLASQPWVEKVSVRRVWPDQLHVSVKEKQAVARWDENNLLSNQAVIFKEDSSRYEYLPKINGYKEQSKQLLKRYTKLQQQLAYAKLSITELSEDSKGATSLLLNNTLRVNLGSDDNAIKIKHLLAVYKKQIQPESDHIKYIDFRYSNGFAIAWKKDYLEQRAKIKRGNLNV